MRVSLAAPLAAEIVAAARQLGAVANVESDDEWFTDRPGRPGARRHPQLRRVGARTMWAASTRSSGAGEPIDKVFVDLRDLDDETAAAAQLVRCSARSPDGPTSTRTLPGLLDFTSIDASKAAMAQQLARQMAIPAEQVMAIGDHDSDAALLQWAGVGVAMGNASPAAKSGCRRHHVVEPAGRRGRGSGSVGARTPGRRHRERSQPGTRGRLTFAGACGASAAPYRMDQRVTPRKAA